MNREPAQDYQPLQRLQGHALVPGRGEGRALILSQPLSLWGGLDPNTGEIIDRRHPCAGAVVTQRVLVLPGGRGSSSASSILLESVRLETAPAALIVLERDGILALGAAVARELYGVAPPLVLLDQASYAQIHANHFVRVFHTGVVEIY